MDKITKAYMAGLIDGEGSIYIERSVRKGRLSGEYTGNLRYRIMVYILMCDQEALRFISKATGQPIYKKSLAAQQRNGITRRSHAYYITWRNGIAAKFLEEILPFLHVKKAQAELALKLHAKVSKQLGVQFTKRDLNYCARIYEKIRDLKHR
jgi:hypothetical protein